MQADGESSFLGLLARSRRLLSAYLPVPFHQPADLQSVYGISSVSLTKDVGGWGLSPFGNLGHKCCLCILYEGAYQLD